MSDSDFEKRKNNRRENIEKKRLDRYEDFSDPRGSNRIKKEFKKNKQEIEQQELWEEWEDEIS
jgi:hypothetical protein